MNMAVILRVPRWSFRSSASLPTSPLGSRGVLAGDPDARNGTRIGAAAVRDHVPGGDAARVGKRCVVKQELSSILT
jgi:hypothetical protein